MYTIDLDIPAAIHKDDYGFDVIFTVMNPINKEVVDISTATAGLAIFDKPEKNGVFSRNLVFVGDGSDGKVKYTFAIDEIDTIGVWQTQLKITLPGSLFYTEFANFDVSSNIEE
ncbi:MAG: hypothetical protein ACXABY_14930 [Candidatus Thorarchaeota archaeon]|jgi:hypothetical protein